MHGARAKNGTYLSSIYFLVEPLPSLFSIIEIYISPASLKVDEKYGTVFAYTQALGSNKVEAIIMSSREPYKWDHVMGFSLPFHSSITRTILIRQEHCIQPGLVSPGKVAMLKPTRLLILENQPQRTNVRRCFL